MFRETPSSAATGRDSAHRLTPPRIDEDQSAPRTIGCSALVEAVAGARRAMTTSAENEMTKSKSLVATLATVALLAGAVPALGHGNSGAGESMGPGAAGPGMTGPNVLGQGMMGQGMMGQGMMGQGMMGSGLMTGPGQAMTPCFVMMPMMMAPAMMGPGTMGPGMMGPGMMGPGMMGLGTPQGGAAQLERDLSKDDVRTKLEKHLTALGNPRLQVGPVTETDDNTVAAEIVTKDGSLVEKLMIDRHTGMMRRSAE